MAHFTTDKPEGLALFFEVKGGSLISFLEKLFNGALKAVEIVEQQAAKTAYQQAKANGSSMGGRTISQWDGQWTRIGVLETVHLTPYNRYVGVYRAFLNGRLVYIGRAIEWNNGGFRKRLSDYRRESDSARKHNSGKLMYQNRKELEIEIIITGTDAKAAETAALLEKIFI